MAKKKPEVAKQKFWLVCTVDLGSQVLFTVPLSIAKKFNRSRYFHIFKEMSKMLVASDRDSLNFDMFLYDPIAGRFAVRAQASSVVGAYFLEGMPWIDPVGEPIWLESFFVHILGVPSDTIDRDKIGREANRAGSRELKIPSPR